MPFSLPPPPLTYSFNIRIYDDHSSEFDPEDLWGIFPFATSISVNARNLRADENMWRMYEDFLSCGDAVLIQLDSDMLVGQGFLEMASQIAQELSLGKEVVYSLYHSICHPHKAGGKTKIINGCEFREKESLGGACVIFARRTIERILSDISIQDNDFSCLDWRWSEYCAKEGIPIYASLCSYVQHIGYGGQNSHRIETLDLGKNFVGSTDLQVLQLMLSYYEGVIFLQREALERRPILFPLGFIRRKLSRHHKLGSLYRKAKRVALCLCNKDKELEK